MTRNSNPGKEKRQAVRGRASAVAYSACRELMVVDQEPFLKKALARCQRIRRDLANRQRDLTRFEGEDQSAYRSWLAVEFGALLTDLREHNDAIVLGEEWLRQIQIAMEWQGVEPEHVYTYVQRYREDPEYWDPRYDPDPSAEVESDENEAEDETFGRMFDGFSGDDRDTEAAEDGDSEHDVDSTGTASTGELASEAKQLYRRLARRLHPDVCETANETTERRWEQLQAARETGDMEQLRALEAICDADEAGLSIRLGLAQLNTWADYHHALLKPLRARVREAKKDPAWGFSTLSKKERTSHSKELRWQLEYDVEFLYDRRKFLESAIDGYRELGKNRAQAPAESRQRTAGKRPKNKKQPINDAKQTEFGFTY